MNNNIYVNSYSKHCQRISAEVYSSLHDFTEIFDENFRYSKYGKKLVGCWLVVLGLTAL